MAEFAGVIMFLTIEFFDKMDIFTSSFKIFVLSIIYLLLMLPFYVHVLLPFSFLVSMLILLILMIRGNEMIIARTSGISTVSLMKPLLAFSMVLVVFSFVLSEWIIPFTSNASDYLLRVKIRGGESQVFFKNDRIWFKKNNVICNIDYFDAKKDMIKGLTVLELSDTFSIKKRYDAQEGTFKDGSWYFTHVIEHTFDANGIVAKKTYAEFKDLIQEPPSFFEVANKDPENMGYRELARYIEKLRNDGHDVRRYLVDLYNKVAFPFANLIMVFAAFPVGLRYMKTKHISVGILSGILLGACYWGVHFLSLAFGYGETFPPLFAAWLSNFLFIAAGIIGIVTLRT